MAITKFNPVRKTADLKSVKLWDTTWAQDTFPQAQFDFYVCQKVADGYRIFGYSASLHEAFTYRRELAKDGQKYFLRAKRSVVIAHDPDSDDSYDYFKGKHAEGVGIEDIPRNLRAGYQAFCRNRRSAG